MKEEHNNHRIDPDLEARIFALVLGEVSELEREQLTELIETRPELATVQADFESVHGLMRSVGTSELSSGEDEEWKLSPERRDVVLAAIRGESQEKRVTQETNKSDNLKLFAHRASRWNIVRIAATVFGAGLIGLMAIAVLLLDRWPRVATRNSFKQVGLATQSYDAAAPQGDDSSGRSSNLTWMFREGQVATPSESVEQKLFQEVDERESLSLESHDFALQLPESGNKIRGYVADAPFSARGTVTESDRLSRFGGMDAGSKPKSPAPASVPFFAGGSKREAGKPVDAWDIDRDLDGSLDSAWVDDGLPELSIPVEKQDSLSEMEVISRAGRYMGMVTSPGKESKLEFDIKLGRNVGVVPSFGSPDASHYSDTPHSGTRPSLSLSSENTQMSSSLDADNATGVVDREAVAKGVAMGQQLGEIESTREKKEVANSGLNESMASDEAFSTFSLHVSDVSFKLAQSALARGEWPEAAKVRIEEFVNAFDYGDPMPSENEKVACRVEQVVHPFLQQRNLLRVSMRTAAAGRDSSTPLRLTFLLDNSGSMERLDRQQTVRRAFALLAQQLTQVDQVTLISFARQPRLLADKVSGEQSNELVGLIDQLPSEGGTNIEAAIQLAFEKARENQLDGAQNRIVLLTDGAVNLGDANPESLSRMIATIRDSGIAFDAAGISAEGLNDEVLEALTRKGDGRYYLLDSLESAGDRFARQIAGALRPSAKNVKVQVEFNPKRVGRYKLLGFEKHLLNQEDFRNDKVDAAEMAAAEAGVAVYQFEAMPDGEGDVGSVSVRFRDLASGQMVENRWPIPYQADAPRLDQASASLRVAASAALFAAKLRGEPLGVSVDLSELAEFVAELPEQERIAPRVQQLQQMFEQARQISGE